MAGIKNQESHFVKQHLHSLHATISLQILAIAHGDAFPKDADACGMELAAAHIAMVANPALTISKKGIGIEGEKITETS